MPRREFLKKAAAAGGGSTVAASSPGVDDAQESKSDSEEEVSAAEDLMREHGVLKRVLLVYREAVRRLSGREDLPPESLAEAARVVREFIEDYHERLEEDFLFPRFRKAMVQVSLVDTLQQQHQAGRRLTDLTLRFSTLEAFRNDESRATLVNCLEQFVHMYEPHEAREDTVLFPALRKTVSPHEYGALGEEFEKKEHQLFGQGGFDKMVDRVATIEQQLGIHDLAQFTAK